MGDNEVYDAIPSCPEMTISNEAFAQFSRSYQCINELNTEPRYCTCGVGHGVTAGVPHIVSQDHFDHCPLGGGTTERHDFMCNKLAQLMRLSGIHVVTKFHAQGPIQSPDLLMSDCMGPGVEACGDVMITCERQAHCVHAAAQVPLSAAAAGEEVKCRKYAAWAATEHRIFIPLVMESTGAFGKRLKAVLHYCAENINQVAFAEAVDQRTWACPTFARYARQVMAVGFWQGSHQMAKAQERVRQAATAHAAAGTVEPPRVPRHRAHGETHSPFPPGPHRPVSTPCSTPRPEPARGSPHSASVRVSPSSHLRV